MQALGSSKVKVRFIDGNHFDHWRKIREDGRNAIAPFRVFRVVTVEENSMRAKASRGAQGHGGLDAIFAGFVTGGGDHAALIGPTANHHGLATKFRTLEQLHGHKKRIHIDMQDASAMGRSKLARSVVPGAKPSEVRHK